MTPGPASNEGLPPQASAAELIAASGGVADERGGSLRMALSNAMVGLKKQYYGKGPSRARAYLMDEYVFVAMEGGLTRSEETLLEDGKADLVRTYRLAFQETVTQTTTRAVEELTGRRVLNYHSQIVFDPVRVFEIFVLDGPAGG
jgi:uncharacterized protein YbcI